MNSRFYTAATTIPAVVGTRVNLSITANVVFQFNTDGDATDRGVQTFEFNNVLVGGSSPINSTRIQVSTRFGNLPVAARAELFLSGGLLQLRIFARGEQINSPNPSNPADTLYTQAVLTDTYTWRASAVVPNPDHAAWLQERDQFNADTATFNARIAQFNQFNGHLPAVRVKQLRYGAAFAAVMLLRSGDTAARTFQTDAGPETLTPLEVLTKVYTADSDLRAALS